MAGQCIGVSSSTSASRHSEMKRCRQLWFGSKRPSVIPTVWQTHLPIHLVAVSARRQSRNVVSVPAGGGFLEQWDAATGSSAEAPRSPPEPIRQPRIGPIGCRKGSEWTRLPRSDPGSANAISGMDAGGMRHQITLEIRRAWLGRLSAGFSQKCFECMVMRARCWGQ
jgi:hypothetical protein